MFGKLGELNIGLSFVILQNGTKDPVLLNPQS